MKQIKRHGVAVFAGAALLGVSGASHGLGMGRASSHAILGEALALTVPVRLDAGEHAEDACLAADVYFGDDKLAASGVAVKLVLDANGAPQVKVSTMAPVNEPVVTVYVVAGCQSRITRKFVALADPPGMQMPGVGSPVTEDPQPAQHPTTAVPAATTPRSPGRAQLANAGAVVPRKKPERNRQDAGADANASPSRPTQVATAMPSLSLAAQARVSTPADAPALKPARGADALPKRVAAKLGGLEESGRLELDPVAADALVAPALRMGTTLATPTYPDQASPELLARRASAAAYWRALQASPDQLARDQARLVELEQRLAELQAQQAPQATVVAASSAVATVAEAPPVTAPVPSSPTTDVQRSRTMGLIGLGVALLLGGGYVLMRGRMGRGKAMDAWWQEQAGETQPPAFLPAEPQDPHPTTVEFVHVPESLLRQAGHGSTMPSVAPEPAAAPPSVLPSSGHPGARFTSMFASLSANAPEPMRAVAVEELIDLEQQAEFFVVLGQDGAAIDLLENYAQQSSVASPLPFLKLMEIYRRLGRHDDYERIRQSFDARFNAHAPAWDADLQQGHSLADYPEVIGRLQALWPQPAQAMAVLEKSLTRPTEGDDTFDLPAYRELLTLYAVARDLAEREGHERVDVLLPLGLEASDANRTAESANAADWHQGIHLPAADVSPLMATRPLTVPSPVVVGVPEIEVDLELEDEPMSVPGRHSP
jgi:pilus assembly protein FimV